MCSIPQIPWVLLFMEESGSPPPQRTNPIFATKPGGGVTNFTPDLEPPVILTQEMDERNAKLLQTLSEATDMLAKADEMQAQAEHVLRIGRCQFSVVETLMLAGCTG